MGLEGLELGRVHGEKLESIFGQLIGKGRAEWLEKFMSEGKLAFYEDFNF